MCEVEIFLFMSDAFKGVQFGGALTIIKPRTYLDESPCFFLGAISHCLIARNYKFLVTDALSLKHD